jgi:hypothetical protein
MRSLMALRAAARSKGARASCTPARGELARTRRFAHAELRAAAAFLRTTYRRGSKAKANVCSPNSNSYIETSAVRVYAGTHAIHLLAVAGTCTITPGLRMNLHRGENCCRYCENIVNITLYEINRFLNATHKLLRNKELVLFPNWPLSCGTKTTCPLSVVRVSLVPKFRL